MKINIKTNDIFVYPTLFFVMAIVFAILITGGVANPCVAKGDTPPENAPIITDIIFTIKGDTDDADHWQQLAAEIWPMAAGETFSVEKLNRAIHALKQSALFHHIDVNSRETKTTIALDVTLRPFDRIRDIHIRGEYPLFERDILNVTTLFVGDTYAPEDLPLQADRITAFLKRQGYPSPQVSVTTRRPTDHRQVIIDINIDKGYYLAVEKVTITGNGAFSDLRLKTKMKAWRGTLKIGSAGRFIEGGIKKDVSRLTAFYRKKGYFDVAIDYRVNTDPGTYRVDILITISEGDHYTFRFDGQSAFSRRRLKKNMVMFDQGMKNGAAVRDSIRRIRDLYAQKGYGKTNVKIDQLAGTEKQDARLTVQIEEGPQTWIDSIRISGNQHITTDRIRAQMLSRPPNLWHAGRLVQDTLSEDLSSIYSLYLKEGFADARIEKTIDTTSSGEQADIRIQIDEGVRTLVTAIRFTGLTLISPKTAKEAMALLPGSPFRQYMVKSDENTLSALVSEKGHPHVKVTSEVSFNDDRQWADITYQVSPGPLVRVGAIAFTGHFKTRERVLRREFSHTTDDPFSLKKTLQETHNLQRLTILDAVKINTPGLETQAETVDLLVNVAERRPYFLEAGTGYATDKGFFAHTKVGDRNISGLNKSLWVDGTIGQTGHRAAIGFSEPRLIGSRWIKTPITADIGAHTERIEAFNQTFGTTLHGANLKIFAHPWPKLSFGWGLRYEYRDQFRRQPCTPLPCMDDPDLFEPRSLLATSPSMLYDTRDSFIRPRSGIFSTFIVDVSKGLQNSLDDFIKYRFALRGFYSPFKRLTLAARGQAGTIDTYGNAGAVPDDQLFFLGGMGNVRGFAENQLRFDENGDPVGGRQTISASLETRFDLGLNVELALFFDTGRIDNTFEDNSNSRFRSAIGGGLRYITPIGPIGIVYGHKLSPLEGESNGRFHFSIGYTF